MFVLDEKVVYPGHGVARITRIVEKTINGQPTTFYEITFLHKEITVLIPMQSAATVGLRSLSSQEHIIGALNILKQPMKKLTQHDFSASSWNKRNKQYNLKLRRGSLVELSEIYRDLRYIETQKELSFGEKTLLQKAEMLLVEEIALVKKNCATTTTEELRTLCGVVKNPIIYSESEIV